MIDPNRESTVFGHYVVGGWYLTLLDVNGLPTFRVRDDDRPAWQVVRIALGRKDAAALRRIADEADKLLDAKGVER